MVKQKLLAYSQMIVWLHYTLHTQKSVRITLLNNSSQVLLLLRFPIPQLVKHCASNAKVMDLMYSLQINSSFLGFIRYAVCSLHMYPLFIHSLNVASSLVAKQ